MARRRANVTEDWRVEDMEGLIRICEQQKVQAPMELEATARAIRMGVARSPWVGTEIRAAISAAPEQLSRRVGGQPKAIGPVCTA